MMALSKTAEMQQIQASPSRNNVRKRWRVAPVFRYVPHVVVFSSWWFLLVLEAYVPPTISSYRSGFTATVDLFSSSPGLKESSLREQPMPTDEGHSTKSRQTRTDATSRFHMDMRRLLQSRQGTSITDIADPMSNGSSVLDAYSPMERRQRPVVLTEDVDGAIRVSTMLRHLVNIDAATEESFQIVLQAFCGRGRLRWKNRDSVVVCAADEVEPLMDELWERQNGKVSTESCDLVLQVYAACSTPRGDRRYAEKAQDLLESMQENGITPSTKSFSAVINAWAWQQGNMKGSKCAEMAQSNLDRLIELNLDDDTALQAMDWVLEAWSKCFTKDAPFKAEKIFQRMKDIQRDKNTSGSSFPNSQSYTNAILAWSKSKENGSAEKAHRMLFQLFEDFEQGNLPENVVPDLFAINGVISAWARIGKAERAEEILWKAIEISKICETVDPDVVTYNSIVHAYLRDASISNAIDRILSIVDYMNEHKDAKPSITPDCFTYHCVLRGWEKSADPQAAQKCVITLETMHRLWEEGDTSLTPKNIFYNMVINKLAKTTVQTSLQSVMRVFHMLQGSRFCSPDIITYTSVVESLSKSRDATAPERCLELFNEVWQLYQENEDPALKPNLRTYTMVLMSLTKNPTLDNVLQARKILSQLEERYEESNDPQLKPNAYPYNYVLNCAASCVGNAGDKLKAFHVATETYNSMRKSSHIKSDSYTYSFWIKASNNLLPEGELRGKCIALAVEQCKKDGLLNSAVLKRLLARTPPNVLSQVLPPDHETSTASYRKLTVDDLPPQWSRNAR